MSAIEQSECCKFNSIPFAFQQPEICNLSLDFKTLLRPACCMHTLRGLTAGRTVDAKNVAAMFDMRRKQ